MNMSTSVADPVVAGVGFAAIRDFASYAKHAPDSVAPAAARIRRRNFAERTLSARFPVSRIQRRRRRTNRAGWRAGARCRCRPREFQLSLRATFARRATHLFDFLPNRHFSIHRSTRKRSSDAVKPAACSIKPPAEKVVPKIFFSNTSYEYWGRAAALIHTSADGKRDADDLAQRPRLPFHRVTAFSAVRFRRKREQATSSARNPNRRCPSNTSGVR